MNKPSIISNDTDRSPAWKAIVDAEHALLDALDRYAQAVEVEGVEGGLEPFEAAQVGSVRSIGVATTFAARMLFAAFLEEGVDVGRQEGRDNALKTLKMHLERVANFVDKNDLLLVATLGSDSPKKALYEIVRQFDEGDYDS